jgi:hypothetical protein
MRVKKINGKLYQVETETQEIISDKYKTRFFIEFLQEFGLDEEFYRCKTEDERYDIYALYTRVGLSKVHPPEYFKRNKGNIDSGVFTSKPNNKDNATFAKKPKKEKPKEEEPKEEKPKEDKPKEEKPKETENCDNEEEVCFKKIVIEQEQLLESFNIAVIRKTIYNLPAKIKRIFFNNNYKIRIEQHVSFGKAAGQCNYNKRLILISCHGDYTVNTIDNTVCHELGHMIDYSYKTHKFISDSPQFKAIYNKEKLGFNVDYLYDYVTRDSKEYFAQAFSEYIRNPWTLKSCSPKTYEFMKNYIDTL